MSQYGYSSSGSVQINNNIKPTVFKTHFSSLATLITAENGKPITESRGEVAYSASFCDWSAEEGRRVIGQTIPSPFPTARIVTIKQPIGVVGMITPWNFPVGINI